MRWSSSSGIVGCLWWCKIRVRMHIGIQLCSCVHMCEHIRVCRCMTWCGNMCGRIGMRMCVRMGVRMCLRMCVYMCLQCVLPSHRHPSESTSSLSSSPMLSFDTKRCVCMCVRMCVHIYIHVCICVAMCMYLLPCTFAAGHEVLEFHPGHPPLPQLGLFF